MKRTCVAWTFAPHDIEGPVLGTLHKKVADAAEEQAMQHSIERAFSDAPAGTRVDGRLHIGEMASGAAMAIPFVLVRGAKLGPTLWINGQVHGNEIAGIVAALDFVNGLDPTEMSGTVIVTATANPLGLDERCLIVPQDVTNLDTVFPGDPTGFVSARMAHALFEAMHSVSPDLAMSMHSQNTFTASRTHGVYKIPPESAVAADFLLPFIAAFSPANICRMRVEPGQGETAGNHAGALDYQLNTIGVPAFMIELGTGQRADPEEVARGMAGFHDTARRLGVLPGTPAATIRQLRHVTRRGHHAVNRGGLFRPAHKPADLIPAGTPLGDVMDLHGHLIEQPSFDHDVVVIAIRIDPVVNSGDRIAYLAHEWEEITIAP